MRMTFLGVDVERVCICDFLSPYLCFTVKITNNKNIKEKTMRKEVALDDL